MNKTDVNTWQGIRDAVLQRIHTREWAAGTLIPNEADLATEFGCARATVNRALRDLAEQGIVERKRRSGTRVMRHPTGRAVLEIPLIRREVEERGQRYSYKLICRKIIQPREHVPAYALNLPDQHEKLHVLALHLANGVPYVLENRWISLTNVPNAREPDFVEYGPNQWLLENVAYTQHDLLISALSCPQSAAETLETSPGTPLLAMDRVTKMENRVLTAVRLLYAPNHRLALGSST